MKKNFKLDEVMSLLKNLPENEANLIVEELYNKLSSKDSVDNSVYSLSNKTTFACRHCGSVHFIKNGKDRHSHTRYLCKDCGKTFSDTTNTVVSGTHKDSDTWKTYIRAMLNGCTLEECASKCNISVPTSFVWRHKILNALNENSFNHTFNGMVEMDEAWVRISYKGNHSKSKDFTMPRAPYKRGSDNHEKSNGARACVLCAVERNKSFSAIIPCRGLLNVKLLDEILDNKFSDDCIVMTDGLHTYSKYFKNTNIEHIVLPSKAERKPTVKGAYHLNNVNAMHSRFKAFLRSYNGVSTKYLNNYLSLFLWLENNKYYDKQNLMCEQLSKAGSQITANKLHQFAPVPDYAPAA